MTQSSDNAVDAPRRILIVEDHPIFRMGLVDLIEQEPDLCVCGAVEDVDEARQAIGDLAPDLVIVDLSLKQSNGFDLVQTINAEHTSLPVLVLSMHDEQIHAERCLRAGARGYINKKETSESVITAIRHILAGNIFLSASMTATILNKFQKNPARLAGSSLSGLTSRELEVFYMIGRGMTPARIADRLQLSVKTIGTHKERIKEKLGLKNAAELVRYAVLWVEKEGGQGAVPPA
ncbi:Oxygen regulatory protein NreC [Desulfosarcina cetonica]|uniref:response regulator transcription factor n=1 Tax=Desulfosarcina cetonica TaxID=90730 RepID=UPI0006D29FD9|nr:response regulator transcription factor [Desulfosarcina cetonica]VTR68326.1 Oxygen regulatory protein NreC [Desulfosarcina cetonica]